MTASETTSTSTSTTNPSPLTATQARALLHALLSTTPNAPHSNHLTAPKPIRRTPYSHPQPPPPSQTITLDASTRIIGHCNTIHLSSSPSSTDQTHRIEHLMRGALSDATRGTQGVNLVVQAGINVMGSKNVICFGSGEGAVGKEEIGKKRRAEVSCTFPIIYGRREEGKRADGIIGFCRWR